ncbi:hypothetical protein [Sporosarcina thermotolerans]|uniref:hypothetical protein n=1 Tax=Sporosarcina thermotolerans TaxID=633404 RepID=UPI00295F3E22|nr:hypothetical protein [Sporosarcina thermotolerans]
MDGNLASSDRQRILNNFKSVLEMVPAEGRNKVIVAHSFPEGIGLGQIPYMGTVIVKPKGEGNGYDVVSQLSLADLSALCS